MKSLSRGILIGFVTLLVVLATTPVAAERPVDPNFIIGYATALLEQSQSLANFSAVYRDETLSVDFSESPETPLDTIERLLLRIDGVEQVELSVAGQVVLTSETLTASGGIPPAPSMDMPSGEPDASDGVVNSKTSPRPNSGYDVFSVQEMFEPLMADPRWPNFSASYQSYLGDDEIEHVGAANFGESFALVRSPEFEWGQWEVGIQAGVFSVFDLQSESNDLVNTDFLVGLTASYHFGDFTWILRLYHQSSHLGDEFLLRNRVNRVNLSFEVLDLLVSFDPWQWLRLYGGGGLLVHRDPALDRGLLQGGFELQSPRAFLSGYIRPVAASDLQFRQESDWKIDASVRAGIQIEHPFLRRTRLRVLGEFYSGRSPNGQFYERRIKTVGLGLHLNF